MSNINSLVKRLLLMAAAIVVFAAPSFADTVTLTGDTSGGMTFNRTVTGAAPGTLSNTATAVRFSVFQFRVGATGNYSIQSDSLTAGYDPFISLYANSFNPGAPLFNFVIANDNLRPGNFTQSGLGVAGSSVPSLILSTGVNYFLVQSGSDNGDFGGFRIVLDGPGTITVGGGQPAPIPEPTTMLLLGTGLVGVVAKARRRRKGNAEV